MILSDSPRWASGPGKVTLRLRPSRAPGWVATWFTVEGAARARRKNVRFFSYGWQRARFSSSDAAREAASVFQLAQRLRIATFVSPDLVDRAYQEAGSLQGLAEALGVSYPTAQRLARDRGLAVKRQGYNRPLLAFSGLQCRHAREYLGLTRDDFCSAADIGKTTLRKFELGQSTPRADRFERIAEMFEGRGVVFLSDGTFAVTSCAGADPE